MPPEKTANLFYNFGRHISLGSALRFIPRTRLPDSNGPQELFGVPNMSTKKPVKQEQAVKYVVTYWARINESQDIPEALLDIFVAYAES